MEERAAYRGQKFNPDELFVTAEELTIPPTAQSSSKNHRPNHCPNHLFLIIHLLSLCPSIISNNVFLSPINCCY